MKKLIAVGILFGTLALSAMPALAQTTNCHQFGTITQCQTYQPYQPPVITNCYQFGSVTQCQSY